MGMVKIVVITAFFSVFFFTGPLTHQQIHFNTLGVKQYFWGTVCCIHQNSRAYVLSDAKKTLRFQMPLSADEKAERIHIR